MRKVALLRALEHAPRPVEHIVGVTLEHLNSHGRSRTEGKVRLAGAVTLEDFARVARYGYAIRGQLPLLAHVGGRVEHVVGLTVVHG